MSKTLIYGYKETIADKNYFCADGSDPHSCSSLSDDRTSCLSEINSIGKEEGVVYRRFFEPDSIFSGSLTVIF